MDSIDLCGKTLQARAVVGGTKLDYFVRLSCAFHCCKIVLCQGCVCVVATMVAIIVAAMMVIQNTMARAMELHQSIALRMASHNRNATNITAWCCLAATRVAKATMPMPMMLVVAPTAQASTQAWQRRVWHWAVLGVYISVNSTLITDVRKLWNARCAMKKATLGPKIAAKMSANGGWTRP